MGVGDWTLLTPKPYYLIPVVVQAGLLVLLTFASLPTPNRDSGVHPVKAITLFSQSQDYSGGTTSGFHGIPY